MKNCLREWEAEDDVKGGPLDPREVKNCPCGTWRFTSTPLKRRHGHGRNPVGLKWVDTNKGHAEPPQYHSRLVCTEVRHKAVEPIFSATLPLETLRILLGVACQEHVFRVKDTSLISIADMSRAHFYADAVRDVHVRLPDEDPKAKQPGVCGETAKDDVRILGRCPTMEKTSCPSFGGGRVFPRRGISVPLLSFHKGLQTDILVHGDEFFIVGRREGREYALSFCEVHTS